MKAASATDRLLLGIDVGTTVLKAAVFHKRTGTRLAASSRRLKVHCLPNEGREQSPDSVLRALTAVLHDLRAKCGQQWNAIGGVGLAAQGGSTIIADRESGTTLTPMILWNDGRTRGYDARISALAPPRYWRRIALRDVPPGGLGRLLWLREEQGSLFHGGNIHVGAGELVYYRLTGTWRQDPGHAIQIGGYDAVKGRLAQRPLDLAGVPLTFLAPLRRGHETAPLSLTAAGRFGLPKGIPVAGPYIDQEAGYLAAMGRAKRPLYCSLGTAWVGNFALPAEMDGGSPFQLVLPNPADAGRLVVQPLLTGNVAWDWALQTLVHPRHDRALEMAGQWLEARPFPESGVTAIPWHTQANPLDSTRSGGGAFLGLGAGTERADLLRAVAAGMVCELRRVFETVATRGVSDGLVLAGGASKGAHFRRMIATAFAPLPVYRLVDEDFAVARGCLYGLSRRVARGPVERCRPPDKQWTSAFQACYERYLRVFEAVYGKVAAGEAYSIRERRKG